MVHIKHDLIDDDIIQIDSHISLLHVLPPIKTKTERALF